MKIEGDGDRRLSTAETCIPLQPLADERGSDRRGYRLGRSSAKAWALRQVEWFVKWVEEDRRHRTITCPTGFSRRELAELHRTLVETV
jgi:hypothetical protein